MIKRVIKLEIKLEIKLWVLPVGTQQLERRTYKPKAVILFPRSKTIMATVKEITLSAKGQIVIPVDLREALALKAGDKLTIRQDGQALVLERRRDVLNALRGKYATPGRSLAAELHNERRAERARP